MERRMTHCRMCSQRLTRPGRLCRECERELTRARMAGIPIEPPALPATSEVARMAMAANGVAPNRLLGRAPLIVAVLSIGAAVAATFHVAGRSDAAVAPRSVMLERDLSDLRPRAFVPVGARAAGVERRAASEAPAPPASIDSSAVHAAAVASDGAPNAPPGNSRPRVVRVSSVGGDAGASIEQAAPVAAERAPERVSGPASRYDRVLAFSDALARCAEESFFARLVCEQRARSRFCNGASDLPQCTSAPPRDYGN
jgi:hypothetical protein